MLRLIIVDDVDNVRESLVKEVQENCEGVELVATANSVKTAVESIRLHKPDVVLLDVEMQDGTGFDVLKHFSVPSFKVIFVTAYQDYSIEAFKFSALDYLLKPVDPDLLAKAIHKAMDVVDKEKLSAKIEAFLQNVGEVNGPKKIALKTQDSIHVVNVADIIYCEASAGYTTIYLKDDTRVVVTKPLSDYDELLSQRHFIRIHQSYLVNLDFIKRYEKGDGGEVVLSNNVKLPVSTRKKEQLMQALSKL